MEARFGLRQIDQVLRDAFFAQNARDHVAVTSGARQGVLQRSPASAGREIVDEAGDLVVHHQRKVGTSLAQLGFRLGPHCRVDREGNLIGLVDGGGFAALPGEAVAFLESQHLQPADTFHHFVELAIQALVGVDGDGTAQKEIKGAIEVFLGRFQMAGANAGFALGVLAPRLAGSALKRRRAWALPAPATWAEWPARPAR